MAAETTGIIAKFARAVVESHYSSLLANRRKFAASIRKNAYPTYARVSIEKLLNMYLKAPAGNGAQSFSADITSIGHIHPVDAYSYAGIMILSVLNAVPVGDIVGNEEILDADAKKRLFEYSELVFADIVPSFCELVVKCTSYHEPFEAEGLVLTFDLVKESE